MPLTTVNEVQDNLDVQVRKLRKVTVKSGENVARGELVMLSAGKVVPFLTTNDPYTVMAEAVDATLGDKVGWAYRDADLKASEVDFGTGTDAEVRNALDYKNIFLMD